MKLGILACLLLLTVVSYSQEPKVFQTTTDDIIISPSSKTAEQLREDTSKVSFEIQFAKTNLLHLEPVIVRFNFTNKTDKTLEIFEPNLVNNLGLKILSNGSTEIVTKLFNYYISGPSATRVLNPGETIEEVVMFEPSEGMFKGVGKYDVQFYLSHPNEKILSNRVSVVVNRLEGVDKEAYDFLRLNPASQYNLFSLEGRENMKALALLELFINRFDASVYYEYAVLGLSNSYQIKGQSEKAKNVLRSLTNPTNELIAKIIEKRLSNLGLK